MTLLWSTGLVAFASIYAVRRPNQDRVGVPAANSNRQLQPEEEITVESTFYLVAFASGFLVTLYFLISYLIYGLLLAYAMGSHHALFEIFQPFFKRCFGRFNPLIQDPFCNVKMQLSDWFLSGSLFTLVVYWFVNRKENYSWMFQDLFGAALCIRMQTSMMLPNLKVASALLSLFFLYDVFFVFISPYIFAKNVMVTVGTGGDTGEAMPMVFSFPKFNQPWAPNSMLGLGDVAFPGFLITFLRNFDVENRLYGTSGYFFPSMVGYFCAMLTTVVVMVVFRHAQPALFYLVPFTLIPTIMISKRRGHFRALWDYKRPGYSKPGRKEQAIREEEEDDFITVSDDTTANSS